MLRTFAAAGFLALAALVPAQQAAAQEAAGGALLGGLAGALIGGAATGRAGGAIAGGIVGGAMGGLIGAQAERRRSFYWWHGACYQAVPGGYAPVPVRYCY